MEQFSFDTVKEFDNHIDLSIPNYSFCADQVAKYASYFTRDYTSVVDLGCSTGKLLKDMKKHDKASYHGYDISENLLPKYDERYPNLIFHKSDLVELSEATLEIRRYKDHCCSGSKPTLLDHGSECCKSSENHSVRKATFPGDISFAFSLFTLQFLPPIKRRMVIEAVGANMISGGAFVSCEKIYSSDAKIQDITTSMYYEFKQKSFSAEEILSKERDLRSIMTPQTLEESIDDLRIIGEPKLFWMSYNFVGLIVIKKD